MNFYKGLGMWPEGEKERVVEFAGDAIRALQKVLKQIEGGAEPVDLQPTLRAAITALQGADEAAAEAAEPVRLVRPVRPGKGAVGGVPVHACRGLCRWGGAGEASQKGRQGGAHERAKAVGGSGGR